jgi:hypothetical protein
MRPRLRAVAATSAPTVAFVVAYSIGGLRVGLMAAIGAAVIALAAGLRVRGYLRHAVVGALVALACTAVAVGTGQARSFFLLPMLFPAASSAAFLCSLLAGRPLAGLVANRVVGGPPDWSSHPPLHRLYRRMTALLAAAGLVSLAAQAALYSRSEIALLGALHIAMGVLWSGITAGTLATSRVAVTRLAGAGTPREPADLP